MAEKQSNKERLKEITAGIEKGIQELFQSDRYRNYLSTMSKFHKYSLNNVMLIHSQMPNATLVAGRKKWQTQFQRNVLDSERSHGIEIIAPASFNKTIQTEKLDPDTQLPILGKDGNPVMVEKTIKIPYFKMVKVYDVSQTDGKPLPQLSMNLTGDVAQYEVFLEALRRTSPVPIEIKPISEDMDGYLNLDTQQITLREGMSQVQTICAGVHEISHAKLHNYDHMAEPADNGETLLTPEEKDKNTEEVEAESISYAVCKYFGIETADNSFGYIATWSQGKELKELRASLETINKTASELITSIEHHFHEICKERGISIAPQEQATAETAPEIFSETDEVTLFSREMATYLLEGSKGRKLPEVPAKDFSGISAWVEEHLRNGDFRPISDAMLDVVVISGQDARFDDLSDRLAHMNQHGAPQKDAVPAPSKRPEYRLISNFRRMAPGEDTYIQKYLHGENSRPIPAEIVYLGTYEDCLAIQNRLRDGSMTESQAKAMDDSEKMYIIEGKTYLHIQRTDEGFDYSLYDKETSKLLDGGQIGTPEQHIYSICLNICDQHGLNGYKVSYAPRELAESLREAQYQPSQEELRDRLVELFAQEDASVPEQQIDVPQPDPYFTQQQLQEFGYTAPDMLPISTDFALVLMERDVPVYMLSADNTESMAFDSEDIAMHVGMFGVTTQDWNEVREQPDVLALQRRFAVSYQQTTAAPKQEAILARENYLRSAEMSMEDDYGMIDGIINNGKAPGKEDSQKEKKPSVVEKLKTQPRQPHRKSTPKKSNEKEL